MEGNFSNRSAGPSTTDRLVLVSVDCVGLLLTVVFNSLHLAVMRKSPRLFSVNLQMCLQLLAVVDLIGGVVCYSVRITTYLQPSWFADELSCNLSGTIRKTLVWSSQAILLVITIDRYIAIAHPLSYYNTLTKRRTLGLVVVALFTVVITTIGLSVYHAQNNVCRTISLPYVIFPCAFVTIVTILNTRILAIVRVHQKRDQVLRKQSCELQNIALSANGECGNANPKQSFSKKHKSTITITVLVGASYLVWMPNIFLLLYRQFAEVRISFAANGVIIWFVYCSFWLNPVVFGAVKKSYRQAVTRLFKGPPPYQPQTSFETYSDTSKRTRQNIS